MGRGFLPMSTAPSALRAEILYRLAFGLGLLIAVACFVAGLAQVAVWSPVINIRHFIVDAFIGRLRRDPSQAAAASAAR